MRNAVFIHNKMYKSKNNRYYNYVKIIIIIQLIVLSKFVIINGTSYENLSKVFFEGVTSIHVSGLYF